MHERHVDIAIIGGSLGGCAAEAPARSTRIPPDDRAAAVLLTEVARWIGGQFTSQGVSAPDEHAYIESFGAPASYLQLRQAIRQRYIDELGAPAVMAQSVLGPGLPLNPGNGWVSRLCFLPGYAHDLLAAAPGERLTGQQVVDAAVDGRQVTAVEVADEAGHRTRIHARYFLDATDLGELLPLTGTDFRSGAEARSDTGEPHAADAPRPHEAQGFTYCLAVEYCPGEDHTIERPAGYERFRESQPYTLAPVGRDGQPVRFRMFVESEQGNPPFWTYRRLHDGALLGGNDIALINWVSNDYHGGDLITATPAERAQFLDEAKRLSLGFLYWLQTECPRDDGGRGYPELKLRPDVMGTADGLAQAPYIRESRRIVPLTRVVEQDITAEHNPGARARSFRDSVGIGWYPMDLHPCVGRPQTSMYAPTRPFQIPLGALIPAHTGNLIAACKNIGTTHLTNGAYRLHPIEWAIGEAAGTLAAFCLAHSVTPHQVHADAWLTWRLQAALVRRGCPIFWAVDVPTGHPAFYPTQMLLVQDVIVPQSERWYTLEIGLDRPLGDGIDVQEVARIADRLNAHSGRVLVDPQRITPDLTWQALCHLMEVALSRL